MKHSKRFNNAIEALIKGYLNDTLVSGTCTACAVGNIIAHSNNQKIEKKNGSFTGKVEVSKATIINSIIPYVTYTVKNPNRWFDQLGLFRHLGRNIESFEQHPENNHKFDVDNVYHTGYSLAEIDRIEYAFEHNTYLEPTPMCLYSEEQIATDVFRGLMAVVDVLCEMEKLNETEIEEVKKKFHETI